jgi:hypothetical protein
MVTPKRLGMKSTTNKFEDFKNKLSEIVDEKFINSWLQRPNIYFNNRKLIDLINDDDYDPLYEMVYRLKT